MTRLPRTLGAAVVAAALVLVVPLLAARSEAGRDAGTGASAVTESLAAEVGAGLPDDPVPVTPAPTPTPTPSDEEPAPPVAPEPRPEPAVTPTWPEVDHELSPEGFRVAVGRGPVVGTFGEVSTYTVEVDPATDVELGAVLPFVREVLEDPERGWTSHGEVRLQWVGDVDEADFRVVIGHPDSVDRHCAEVDLETYGMSSCWDGERTMLNAWRWQAGAFHFDDDFETYRTYLVNHEVGHALGREHVDCPSPGELAPIMMQQTLSVGECEPNGWPWP